ncbi:MAG: lauroyl acyltransferase [Alphaproteobacteria bacterium]|jgi:Kdo2-lipid IVA lauroyltransferase/acyltransferase|nr:lauroyl acyltransferase [Alphaproteobacteria bacterium]MBT4083374.1 lauroyl acyltransferase [Alphaproteobacteria bacterium]MBT4542974.1 lauroyl acyltransferase [Alphaproteobacteria bacterium]MBT5920240.1 lauroyl acyltransferase [Alphaproteobacteria bacterium]MBT6384444.1 lauroyl acyltransferase [Alphaproteobacteria bacterium]
MADTVQTGHAGYRLKHILEAVAVRGLMGLFSLLPIDAASACGGYLARWIGPVLGVSRGAAARLQEFFPDKSKSEIQDIVADMWENLGRTVAEFPHLSKLDTTVSNDRIELVGAETIDGLKSRGQASIFFSAHFANWELVPLTVDQRSMKTTIAYREANNPLVDKMIRDLRARAVTASHVPKGAAGAKALLLALKNGESLGLLVDQKMNDGIAVPLFGRDAMTAPALAQLALKFNAPIVPIHCERLKGARFRIVVEDPLTVSISGDKSTDIYNIMCQVNAHIEAWVRENPAQWMWLHKRWPVA